MIRVKAGKFEGTCTCYTWEGNDPRVVQILSNMMEDVGSSAAHPGLVEQEAIRVAKKLLPNCEIEVVEDLTPPPEGSVE